MTDAVPPWQAFPGSDGPARPDGRARQDAPATGRSASWLAGVVALALVAAIAVGAALAAVGLVLIGPGLDRPGTAADAGLFTDVGTDRLAGITEPAPSVANAELVVHVAGAVRQPGLHRLAPGARIGDAVDAAGGFGARVDLDEAARTLNLAAPLSDGAKVFVPSLGTGTGPVKADGDRRIDLNRADQAALETLPGIGPVTARRIIDAREDAPFERIGDLRARGIVGAAVYEKVSKLVRAGA